jgi:hypothetical protein
LRLLNTILQLSWQRVSSGEWLTAVSASRKKYDTPTLAVWLRHSAVWNWAKMTLEIKLCELTAPFEHCFVNETNGNSGKFFKLVKQKMY